jgi:mannose-6-phosphate isomerase-like protein (cupin superfamily)
LTINTELEIGHRPWGRYEVLSVKEDYKVKRIIVLPKGKLSLQLHQYRSEHWVVVEGEAKVTNGEETLILNVNTKR